MNNQKKVAIITGGNKGIGLGITKALLSNNFIVIVGARSHLPEELNSKKDIIFIKGDVSEFNFHQKLVSSAINNFGKIDLYVNNAGFSEWRPINLIDEEFIDNIFSVNLFSIFWGCKASIPFLKKNGNIINISSIAGKRGSSNNSAYCATKFGINGLTQALSKEVGDKGIRVNAICPVLVKTKGLLEALDKPMSPGSREPEKFIDNFRISQSALKRLPTSQEIAEVVLFLSSESASAITGQCINVDCGVFPQ